jgi:hypothetical protein
MALPSSIRAGRRRALRNMPDELAIYRTESVWNDETGLFEDTDVTVYVGPGQVTTYEPQESRPEAGAHQYTLQRYAVKIPVLDVDVNIDDRAVVLKAPYWPGLAGHEYTIAGLHAISRGVSQRLLTNEEVA